MALPASENFNGNTENPLATNWSVSTVGVFGHGLKGYSNGATAGTSNDNNSSFWDADTFDDDQYAQVLIVNNSGFGGVCLRHDTTKDQFYYIYIRDVNRLRLSDANGNVLTTLVNNGRYTSGGTLRAEVTGHVIEFFWNDVSQGTYDDTAELADSGPAGIVCYGITTTTVYLDDFLAGNLGGAPAFNRAPTMLNVF